MKKLSFFLLFATACMAQGDSPKPKPAAVYRQDWKSISLTAGLAGAELYDGFSTKRFINGCPNCDEKDPLARALLGSKPTWPRMVAFGTLEAGGAHFVAQWMRRSRNRWVRKFWWAPEAGLITAHLYQGSGNFLRAPNDRSSK